jgi:hypothetical protein
MAEDKSEDSEKKPSYLPIAGALFLGIVVGAALGSGDEAALKVKRDLEGRLAAAEQHLAAAEGRVEEAVAAAQEASSSAVDQATSAAVEQLAALEANLAELSGAVENAGDSEEVAAICNRVNVLAQPDGGRRSRSRRARRAIRWRRVAEEAPRRRGRGV